MTGVLMYMIYSLHWVWWLGCTVSCLASQLALHLAAVVVTFCASLIPRACGVWLLPHAWFVDLLCDVLCACCPASFPRMWPNKYRCVVAAILSCGTLVRCLRLATHQPLVGLCVCVHSLRQDCSCSPGLELLCLDEIVMIMFGCAKLCVACLLCLLARACDMLTALL